jgi:ferredoxin hydrogenase large subunit
MVCMGGCVGGPSKNKNEAEFKKDRDTLIAQADAREVHENIRNLGLENLHMHRK